jgi:large subunit ribosomal protein L15
MNLSQLHPPAGSRHSRKRVGRGPGSGLGKTSGRGEKGQKSRSGYSRKRGFEGGQMPLIRRVPKRGFHNLFRKEFAIVNVGRLDKIEGDEVTPQSLLATGVISRLLDGLKILGDGELTRALKVSAHRVSKSARDKIEAVGGKVELIEAPAPSREAAAEASAREKKAAAKAKKPAAAKSEEEAKPAAKPAPKSEPKAAKPKESAPKKTADAKPAKAGTSETPRKKK